MSTVPILLPVSLLLPPVALPTRNFAYRCDWKPDTSLPLPPSLSASLSLSVCVMTQDIVTARMHRFVLLPNALFPCLNATCDTHVTVRLIPDMHRRSDEFPAITLLMTRSQNDFYRYSDWKCTGGLLCLELIHCDKSQRCSHEARRTNTQTRLPRNVTLDVTRYVPTHVTR